MIDTSLLPNLCPSIASFADWYTGRPIAPGFIHDILIAAPSKFTANADNELKFISNHITPILQTYKSMNSWLEIRSMYEFRQYPGNNDGYVLLYLNIPDISPNEMAKCIENILSAYEKAIIMVGPVCTPGQYAMYAKAGAMYCVMCEKPFLESPVSYKMDKLLSESYRLQKEYNLGAGIIAGYINNLADAVKALAFGASNVMLYEPIVSCYESAAEFLMDNTLYYKFPKHSPYYNYNQFRILPNGNLTFDIVTKQYTENGSTPGEDFKVALIAHNDIDKYTAEPVDNTLRQTELYGTTKVCYTLQSMMQKFYMILKSTMSYMNCSNLTEFIGCEANHQWI